MSLKLKLKFPSQMLSETSQWEYYKKCGNVPIIKYLHPLLTPSTPLRKHWLLEGTQPPADALEGMSEYYETFDKSAMTKKSRLLKPRAVETASHTGLDDTRDRIHTELASPTQ